jgi:hypothetical protein
MDIELSSPDYPQVSARVTIDSLIPPVAHISIPTSVKTLPAAQSQKEEKEEEEQALLYNSQQRSPEFMNRRFEEQHERQTIYVDIYKLGAIKVLTELIARGNKTDFYNEALQLMLDKHADLLGNYEEHIRYQEEFVRQKHHLE